MSRRTIATRDDSGTILPFIAIALTALFAFLALSIDLGYLYNIRRSAQDAADAAALGGGLEFYRPEMDMRDEVLRLARANLINDYSDPEWDAQWATCSDPDRPAGFVPLLGSECISVNRMAGRLRVKVPEQQFNTLFAHIIGVDTLQSSAVSMVEVEPLPVLPFGMAPGTPVGENCLKNPPGGHALLPCTGPTSGNFGSIESLRYTRACAGSKSDNLIENLLTGIDHPLGIKTAADPVISEACYNYRPNQVMTDSGGFDKEAAEGMIMGSSLLPGTPGLLTRGSNPKRQVRIVGTVYQVDNVPLWDYLIPNTTPGCDPAIIGAMAEDAAAVAMSGCLNAWTSGELFSTSILDSPRFGVVMVFNEVTPPTGSDPRTIAGFRPIFVHRLGFPTEVISPGGNGLVTVDDRLEQVTSFVLPPTPIVLSRSGDAGSGVRPASVGLR